MDNENPYTKLLGSMRQVAIGSQTNKGAVVGVVKTANPLRIQANGILFDEDDLLINEFLLPHTREVEFDGAVCEVAGFSGDLQFVDDYLQKGDNVLMLPSADGQTYYVVCKLVGVS